MRLIISSRFLAQELNKHNLSRNYIDTIVFENHKVFLINKEREEIFLSNQNPSKKGHVMQGHVGWGHIKKLVNQIDDQPIVLDASSGRMVISFTF